MTTFQSLCASLYSDASRLGYTSGNFEIKIIFNDDILLGVLSMCPGISALVLNYSCSVIADVGTTQLLLALFLALHSNKDSMETVPTISE